MGAKKNKRRKRPIKKPFYKKKWFWIVLAVILVAGFSFQNDSNKENTSAVNPEPINTTALESTVYPSVETAMPTMLVTPTDVAPTPNHRTNMYGISDGNIEQIGNILFDNVVRNDTTGNWRLARLAANVQIEKYALSYYKKYFTNDSEIHGIVNFITNTTTRLSCSSDILFITIHEYVDKEEHDAKVLFGGDVLKEYWIYTDNGDIELIE